MSQTIATGISAFAATNLDDLLVLLVFFSQVNPKDSRRIHSGTRSIVLGQYLGFTALVVVSLLGFLGRLVIPIHWLRWLGLLPIGIGLASLLSTPDNDENPPPQATRIIEVATVTIANGSDNLSIYIPLFANQTIEALILLIAIFYAMVALWCGIARWLIKRDRIAKLLHQYAAVLVPWTLIAIGAHILLG